MKLKLYLAAATALAASAWAGSTSAQDAPMSFFVTSVGLGDGGNLGGLDGADAHCQALAEAVGAGDRTWHAYLSVLMGVAGATETINARDRIGTGPWYNAAGVEIAADLAILHTDDNNINKDTALNESGGVVNGRGDTPNTHDMLTGSLQDGTADATNGTCLNWTSASDADRTTLGHHDLTGNSAGVNHWNYSHASAGCSQPALVRTGGAGLFYCFAID